MCMRVVSNMYIYHLPYDERRKLCHILDQGNKWEELALRHMKYDEVTIQGLKKEVFRGNSSSSELLTMWGYQNHTVLELFILLGRMELYSAMLLIKKFVESKYHVLIKEDNIDLAMKRMHIVDSKMATENFDKNTIKMLAKEVLPMVSRDSNESFKLDNIPKLLKPQLKIPSASSKVLTACVAESAGATPQIPYEELEKATMGWNVGHILGKGGFGTVFKGTWKCTQVAIKRLEIKKDRPEYYNEQLKQSITELHCLNAYRHDNILPLYGYSIGGQHPCLVYQYMAGGSLETRLRTRDPRKVLKWPSRLNIATGVARGLQFLHTTLAQDKPLVHGDIKSANILLDPMDQPRIGDFGLAREGPEKHYTHIKVSRIYGTRPYLPDEFLRAKQFSTKVDTYSFGVVLFELGTALPAYSDQRELKFLKDHVDKYEGDVTDLKDRGAEGYDFYFKELIRIGKLCVQKKAKDRPEMVRVLIMLEDVQSAGSDSDDNKLIEFL
ncbi:serine/threonine-protein kinase pelle-like [Cylas formicarius]|uniref:serine/threonine-protein kinase pelle-like n=1 Tax=Cylas formicarius TaxID=197179 RepID=UPI00295858D8|nr:serine/threonine-protein kinase pelle-like [Cylas formicarius]